MANINENAQSSATQCNRIAEYLKNGFSITSQLQTQDDGTGILCSCNGKFNIVTADNPVDACYEMILKLHELKML